jgi:hydrogenase maturation protease
MKKRNLVIGIGSTLISDDGIGVRVIEEIERMGLQDTDVEEASVSGLDLIEMMLDHKRVVVVDAITTGVNPPGTITVLRPIDISSTVHGTNPHDTNVATALELGRTLESERFPKDILFVAIEAENTVDISEEMTPEVKRALPKAVKKVLELLEK